MLHLSLYRVEQACLGVLEYARRMEYARPLECAALQALLDRLIGSSQAKLHCKPSQFRVNL